MLIVRLIRANERHDDYIVVYNTNDLCDSQGLELNEFTSENERTVNIRGVHTNKIEDDHFVVPTVPELYSISRCHQRRTSNNDWEVVNWIAPSWIREQQMIDKQREDARNRSTPLPYGGV
jgi:hypothetical protein